MERKPWLITLIRKNSTMLETRNLLCGSYYQFESLASSRTCYFENEEEIELFRALWRRYLGNYVDVHKMYLSSEGYQILLKIKGRRVINENYLKRCRRIKREINKKFIEEPWRIISEQVRIFHSTYVKGVNKMRGREGVMVKTRYKRFYFESEKEYKEYEKDMENGKEIESQRKEKYKVSERWKSGVSWGIIRGVEWVESTMSITFNIHVVSKLISNTFNSHYPPP